MTETKPTTRGPLDGLIVADLSRVLAGPYCTMLLADLGATVIKVESPEGDDTRSWTPPEREGVSTYYLSINRNKKSITLDFRNPDDVSIVHELFARADVVVENTRVANSTCPAAIGGVPLRMDVRCVAVDDTRSSDVVLRGNKYIDG